MFSRIKIRKIKLSYARKQRARLPMSNIQMHGHYQGFTLIEILVVILIIAIISAVAGFAISHFNQDRQEKMIVEQFARTIVVAQQEAILTPLVLGLSLDANGYRYLQYDLGARNKNPWVPLPDDALSNTTGFKNHLQLENQAKNQKSKQIILFLPGGYVTPFTVSLKGNSQIYTITAVNNGSTKVTMQAIAK